MPNPITVLRKNIAIGWHLRANDGEFVHRGLHLQIPSSVKRDVRHMIVSENYENEEFELITKWLPRDLPVIEFGGCLGVVSAHIRRSISPDVQLIVVEANPDIVDVCEDNAKRPSPDSPTKVICGAIAYGVKEVSFQMRRNLHVSRIADEGEGNFVCPAFTLGNIVEQLPNEGPFALVCDIEGGEYEMMAADTSVLARCQTAIVETHASQFDDPKSKTEALIADAASAGLSLVDQIGDVIVLTRL